MSQAQILFRITKRLFHIQNLMMKECILIFLKYRPRKLTQFPSILETIFLIKLILIMLEHMNSNYFMISLNSRLVPNTHRWKTLRLLREALFKSFRCNFNQMIQKVMLMLKLDIMKVLIVLNGKCILKDFLMMESVEKFL